MDYNICNGPEITRKTLMFISVIHVVQIWPTSESDFRQLFVLKVFNFSVDTNAPFITLRIHNHFLPVFSRVGQNLHSLSSCGRPERVLLPNMFFFDQQGYFGCADLGSKKRSYEY